MACRVQTAEMRTTLRACKPHVVLFKLIEANSQALPLTCERVRDQKLVSDKTGTQTVKSCFLGMFFIQSGCDLCGTCFSFSCGKVRAPARLVRLSCVCAVL